MNKKELTFHHGAPVSPAAPHMPVAPAAAYMPEAPAQNQQNTETTMTLTATLAHHGMSFKSKGASGMLPHPWSTPEGSSTSVGYNQGPGFYLKVTFCCSKRELIIGKN